MRLVLVARLAQPRRPRSTRPGATTQAGGVDDPLGLRSRRRAAPMDGDAAVGHARGRPRSSRPDWPGR
jgi:hypothetical protein